MYENRWPPREAEYIAPGGGRRDGYRTHAGVEFEVARGELPKSSLILEKDDLTVRLSARLKADAHLCHRRVADILALPIHAAGTVRTTDDKAALADCGKHRVSVAVGEERRALTRVLEQIDGIDVGICKGLNAAFRGKKSRPAPAGTCFAPPNAAAPPDSNGDQSETIHGFGSRRLGRKCRFLSLPRGSPMSTQRDARTAAAAVPLLPGV